MGVIRRGNMGERPAIRRTGVSPAREAA